MQEWWRRAFTDDYQQLYAHRDDASAAAEVAGVLPLLRSCDGPILDACCGNGRHLQALRRAGLRASGFDFSADLLARAAQRDDCRGHLLRGDLREPALASGWGAVLLFFTAFGYFDDAGNAAVLAELAGLLRPGGLLMLDQPDPEHLRANLRSESERHTPDGTLLRESRQLTHDRVEKTVTLIRDGRSERITESVRLYEEDELTALAQRHGLRHDGRWRSLLGPEHDDDRLVLWLRK